MYIESTPRMVGVVSHLLSRAENDNGYLVAIV